MDLSVGQPPMIVNGTKDPSDVRTAIVIAIVLVSLFHQRRSKIDNEHEHEHEDDLR
jgi:hypothetical protein